jgi:hypothetical protein
MTKPRLIFFVALGMLVGASHVHAADFEIGGWENAPLRDDSLLSSTATSKGSRMSAARFPTGYASCISAQPGRTPTRPIYWVLEPYATSHSELDADEPMQEEVRNVARTLLQAVKSNRANNHDHGSAKGSSAAELIDVYRTDSMPCAGLSSRSSPSAANSARRCSETGAPAAHGLNRYSPPLSLVA